jgi:hypothetical protein
MAASTLRPCFGQPAKVCIPCTFDTVTHSLQYLSNELRILKWDEYPFKTLPLSFHPEELIDLDLSYSQVEQLWKGEQA